MRRNEILPLAVKFSGTGALYPMRGGSHSPSTAANRGQPRGNVPSARLDRHSPRVCAAERSEQGVGAPAGFARRGRGAELLASINDRARDEADGRHRRIQQVTQHVDEDATHGDVAPEALEEIRAVAQPLDHRVELILAYDDVHARLIDPPRLR